MSAAAMQPMQTPPPSYHHQPYLHRPRFDGGPIRHDGGYRPRYQRSPFPPSSRFRPPGYAGQINDGRNPRPWNDLRPGYTPMSSYNQGGNKAKKNSHRKTIDYNSTVLKTLQNRLYLRDSDEAPALLPDTLYQSELTTPSEMRHNPINCVTTKFIRQSTNKFRCPIFCVAWTPEGRRLITGASSGEFTLWNGLTFNFETILQAHDSSVRSMVWSHDDNWMITADHSGFVKYWQSNMNNVKMFQAHKEAIRGLSFSPTDNKFASCSDDGSVRIFDFASCTEERILKGHGADVKCVDWHPQKSIIVSGSKDSQQPIKLWDARTGTSLSTIHAHKSTVMSMKWNKNGNWFLTASRDHLLKLFDIRNMKCDFQTFKGHQKEATVVSWHPIYEDFFSSGGSDGAVKFWSVGTDKEVGANDTAHEGFIWSMAWHPLGHILVTGSNDHSTKFWARNKPGDTMKDRYNLNLLPIEDEQDEQQTAGSGGTSGGTTGAAVIASYSSSAPSSLPVLPGMGIDEEMIEKIKQASGRDGIPGLDMDGKDMSSEVFLQEKKGKYTFTKRIDKSFAAMWEGKSDAHTYQGPPEPAPSLLGDHPDDSADRSTSSGPHSQSYPGGGGGGGGLLDKPSLPHSKQYSNSSKSYHSPLAHPAHGFAGPAAPVPNFTHQHTDDFDVSRSNFNGPRNTGPNHSGPRNSTQFNGSRNSGQFNGPRNFGPFNGPRNSGPFNGPRSFGPYNGPRNSGSFNGPRTSGQFTGPRAS